jgi:acyl-CoA thioester hydrolase
MTGSHEVEIRWADLDGFGHVGHRAYLDFLEEARNAMLDGLIGPERRRAFALQRIAIDYLAQLTQRDDDRVRVTIRIAAVEDDALTTEEEAASAADGRLAVRAQAVLRSADAAALAALRQRLETAAQQG